MLVTVLLYKEAEMESTTTLIYFVDDLEAVEPDALPGYGNTSPPPEGSVEVTHCYVDGRGIDRVMVSATNRSELVAYLQKFWGFADEDEWVNTRIEEGEV